MANAVTGIRILCSIALLFCTAFSLPFNILYLAAGLSDMVDGTIARKTGTDSESGAAFDTVADFIFVVICLVKLLPVLDIPVWVLVWAGIIALVKIANAIRGYASFGKLIAPHTVLNKITGLLLFVLPMTCTIIDVHFSAAIVCAVATFAAVQEGPRGRRERTEPA